jgi:hypothetical protein
MQTPGLPTSSPSSPRNNAAESFLSEKPANAGGHFGDVMHRALHSGAGIFPVSSRSHGQDARAPIEQDPEKHDTDNKSSDLKSKKPLRRTSDGQLLADNSVAASPQFIGLTALTTPTPVSTPTQPAGSAHASPPTVDSVTPLSADATNTTVKNADPSETQADDATAKPIPAGMEPHAAEADGSVAHPQNPPAADIAKALATEAQAAQTPDAEATADTASPALSGDSGPALTQIAESKSAVDPLSALPPNARGTPSAKQDVTMKKAEKMQKVAGSAEQDLPGNTATGSEELPKGQKISEKAASHGEKADSATIELPTRVSTSIEQPSATITSAAPASANFDSRVLERTHDIVALHAMRLTDTGAESLHVVVKPGAGVQISLELRQSARGIEVRAELHKGDYDQLNQHWPDLQQRLEARGVRVSSLTPSENYTGAGHHFNQSKQQSSQQESLHAGAFAEFALSGSMTEAPAARAARASAYRGWETWA